MASITVRDLDDLTKKRLKVRAARHNRSMEDEVRHILRAVVAQDDAPPVDLAATLRRRFAEVGGVDLEIPPREPIREPVREARARRR